MPAKKDTSKKVEEKTTEVEASTEKTVEKKDSPKKSPKAKSTSSPKKTTSMKKTKVETPNKRLVPKSDKRVVQKIERLVAEKEEEHKNTSEVDIVKGKGKKFEDIEDIEKEVNKRLRNDELLKLVHTILYTRPTKKTALKANILAFNGVVYKDEHGRKKLEERIARYHAQDVREVAAFFGLNPSGKKDEIVDRISDFLEKPKATDETYSSGSVNPKKTTTTKTTKSTSKSSSKSRSPKKGDKAKRKKKDPNAPKRNLSAYMFFAKDKRTDLVKKYPKDKITDIAKRLGEKWGKLTSDDKKKYESKAAKDKERYLKESKAYEKKSKK